jgi:hypothetical protein
VKTLAWAIALMGMGAAGALQASSEEDRKAVAALDTEFQAAVKRNDAATIDRILHEDMVLVLGDGRTIRRADIVQRAREKSIEYQYQDEDPIRTCARRKAGATHSGRRR